MAHSRDAKQRKDADQYGRDILRSSSCPSPCSTWRRGAPQLQRRWQRLCTDFLTGFLGRPDSSGVVGGHWIQDERWTWLGVGRSRRPRPRGGSTPGSRVPLCAPLAPVLD